MKNILIADAGSSKTDWTLLDSKGQPVRFHTLGLNPAHADKEHLLSVLKDSESFFKSYEINEIRFYGAGCASDVLKNKIKNCLELTFHIPEIYVESDLVAAGLGLFGDEKGFVAILGTGSSSGIISKGKIIYNVPSLGYILGDEGSGVALGKILLNAVYKGVLPHEIIDKFQEDYHLSVGEIIENVYKNPHAASYIASFSPFILKNITHEAIKELVRDEFKRFFKRNVLPYREIENLEIGFVGSIAHNYSSLLTETANIFNLKIAKILQKPMLSLENYFSQK